MLRKEAVQMSIATGDEHRAAQAKYEEIIQLKIDIETEVKG